MARAPDARIYAGHVMHMRLIPRRHRFRYRVFSLLVDIDRLDETAARSRLFSHNRFAPLAIQDRDHGPRDGTALRPWVDATLAREGLPRPARVEMLAFPRMWGVVFNPLTVYFCYDSADRPSAFLYEVKNTFGDQTTYLHAAEPGRDGLHRHSRAKAMHVSPFIAMDQTYRFDVEPPGDRLRLRIRQGGPEGETLIATHSATARAFSDRALASVILRHPLMTLKVIAAIHWEALRLLLKGVPLAGAPKAAGTGEAAGRA